MKTQLTSGDPLRISSSELNMRGFIFAAVVIICLLFAAPAAATPDDATVFAGGSFPSASALADALNSAGEGTVTVSGSTITLEKDINITGTVELTGPVTLLGNGRTIWRGGADFFLINVTSGTLTLGDGTSQLTVHGQDSKFNKGTGNDYGLIHVTGSGSQLIMNTGVTVTNSSVSNTLVDEFTIQRNGGGIAVSNGANFILTGGTISGNTAAAGNGVYIWNANMTMTGGEISGNMGYRGGGIYNSAGSLTMSGGEISGNSAPKGGGIFLVNSANFMLTGGTISGNSATSEGGGININTKSIMTMTGGTISNNSAPSGGGICNYWSLTLSGGTIVSGNSANNGGGICNQGRGTVRVSGGIISDNSASGNGGGIQNSGSFTLSGGKISNNSANNGGGIHNSGSFTLSGGTISTNTAGSDGGGIYNIGGSITLSGGEISNNTASGKGGGIYCWSGGMSLTGGTISNNTAGSNGGGIYSEPTITLGGTIVSGNSANNGGGICIQGRGTVRVSGGIISDNVAKNVGGGIHVNAASCGLEISGGLLRNNTAGGDGGGVNMGSGTVTLTGGTFQENKDKTGGNGFYLYSGESLNISGPVTFNTDNTFRIVGLPKSTIRITGPYSGSIQTLSIESENLDNKTLITILPEANQKASDLISRFGLNDTAKWTLAADDATNTIKSVLNKPRAITGNITWINATVANVSIRLDPDANDATDITVKLGSVSSQTLTGSYAKGSTIKDIQITGLTAGTKYTLSAELKNTGISQSTFTYNNLATGTAPPPAKVVITGDGGSPLGDSVALGQGKSMTFGVLVYDAGNNLLKDEPVSWSKTGTYTTLSESTAFSATLIGGNVDGTDTLTATTVHDSASGSIDVEVTTSEPTSLAVTADATTIEEGGSFSLTATATDVGGKQFAGYDVSWSVSSGSISASKSGSTVRFTPAAGTYTVSAQISSPSLASNTLTLTVVGKPVITTPPAGADYVKGQTAAALTVTASAPAGGSGDLGYSWEKSTDPSFASGVTVVGTGESLTPDISTPGTVYYRVNVSYTENGFSTYAASSSAKVTVVNPVADTISLTKANDGTRVVTITAALTNSTIGAMQSAGVGWEIISGTENISLSGSGNSVAATGKRDGTATVKAVALGNFSLFKTIDVTVTGVPPTPTPTMPTPVPTSSGESGGGSSSSGSVSSTGQASFGTSTGVTGVSFAKGTTGLVTLETKPAGVAAPANAHAVVDISAPAFEGAAEISFSVPVSVLRDQGLSVNDVVMHHYANGAWTKLPTFFVGEERGAARYVAQTTSFSPFAIVYESGGAQTVERSTPQPTKDAGASATTKPTAKQTESKTSTTTSATAAPTTSAATGGATAVPTMTQAPAPVAGMLLGLLAAAGVLIRRRE